jgi:hypothetical protein
MKTNLVHLGGIEKGTSLESIQQAGIDRYGQLWLDAMTVLANHYQNKIDMTNPAVRKLIVQTALLTLNEAFSSGAFRHGFKNGSPDREKD